jgi:uncharacterized protein YkwD
MIQAGVFQVARVIPAGVAALVLLCAFALQPARAANLTTQLPGDPGLVTLLSAEQALLDLTNADRVANGLEPLEFDAETFAIARQRAASQLGPQSLSHYDASGELVFVRLLADAQVTYQLAGENLARASGDDPTVTQRIEEALMKSPTHRQNILDGTFHRVAIGAATDPVTGQISFAELYRN